ncbi:MAG: FAD-binding protein, partial [Coriobacteriia bacterium]|nr:FAD-binding protein [Coriobacteriia bacterium]
PKPISTEWTSANPGDLGDGIIAGMDVGAATALMDDAWWGPTLINPNGSAQFMIWERSNPFSIIVDMAGSRFMNESASYVDCGHWMYEHNEKVPCIPAYMIIDSNHRKRYMLGMMMPKSNSKAAFSSGFLTQANTLEELAEKVHIDAAALKSTVERFNGFCVTGIDEDFGRGDNAYDRFYSDAADAKPNPNLGPIAVPPFYALKVWPGDLSTKGGLLTDEFARVLDLSGAVIEGLYATGNNSAAVMGRTYPGAGSTIGQAMTFGYVAAKHATGAYALSGAVD